MIVTESKIDATRRLQKDGRWHKASEYRAEQRQKFHAEGMTKSEAREKSWEAMMKKYPDDDGFTHFMALSEFPPLCLDPKPASFFSVYCRVRAVLHAKCPDEMTQVDEPTTERRLKSENTLPPHGLFGSREEFRAQFNDLLPFAFAHPVDFLGDCCEVLLKAANEMPDTVEESRTELLAYVDSIPALQRIVQKRFSGALCP